MEDVIKSLRLVNPTKFIQSFNRTNLVFRVEEKPDKINDAMEYVADFIKKQNSSTNSGRCAMVFPLSVMASRISEDLAYARQPGARTRVPVEGRVGMHYAPSTARDCPF